MARFTEMGRGSLLAVVGLAALALASFGILVGIAGAVHDGEHSLHDAEHASNAHLHDLDGDGEADEIRARFPSFDWLNWDEIRELRASGAEIGSHSCTHPSMRAELGTNRLRAEIERSRERIAAEVGAVPSAFVYPYGAPDDVSASVCSRKCSIQTET